MLAGKTALITGSTSGIGLGIAEYLAQNGVQIVLNGMGDALEIEATRARLEATYKVRVRFHGADMSQPEAIEAMFAFIETEFCGVDILVNNAGIQFVAPIDEFPRSKWDAILAINLTSVISHHSSRFAGHEAEEMGPDYSDRLGARAGGLALQVRLRCSQARHRRPDQDGGTRSGRTGHHGQRGVSRICLDPVGRKADSGDGQSARYQRGRGDPERAAHGPADQEICHCGTGRGTGRFSGQRGGRLDHGRGDSD